MGGVLLRLHPRLGPAGGWQHVVLRQQLVELLLPEQHTICYQDHYPHLQQHHHCYLLACLQYLSWDAIMSCGLKYCF